MARIPNDEFQLYADEAKHQEILSSLRSFANHPPLEKVGEALAPVLEKNNQSLEAFSQMFGKNVEAMEAIAVKENIPDLSPLIDEMRAGWAEIARLLKPPKSFKIERDENGLIVRITAER